MIRGDQSEESEERDRKQILRDFQGLADRDGRISLYYVLYLLLPIRRLSEEPEETSLSSSMYVMY